MRIYCSTVDVEGFKVEAERMTQTGAEALGVPAKGYYWHRKHRLTCAHVRHTNISTF